MRGAQSSQPEHCQRLRTLDIDPSSARPAIGPLSKMAPDSADLRGGETRVCAVAQGPVLWDYPDAVMPDHLGGIQALSPDCYTSASHTWRHA